MDPSDLNTPLLLGLLFGLFVPSLMRGRHRLPVALNWEGNGMPEPSVTPATFLHPKYGEHLGHRAKHCRSDQEIVELITGLWRKPPADAAMDPPLAQEGL